MFLAQQRQLIENIEKEKLSKGKVSVEIRRSEEGAWFPIFTFEKVANGVHVGVRSQSGSSREWNNLNRLIGWLEELGISKAIVNFEKTETEYKDEHD